MLEQHILDEVQLVVPGGCECVAGTISSSRYWEGLSSRYWLRFSWGYLVDVSVWQEPSAAADTGKG
jgi:hypothetical protein